MTTASIAANPLENAIPWRGVAAHNRHHLVLKDQLLGLLSEDLDHRLRVFDDRLDLLAEHAAGGIDLSDREQLRIVQRPLDDRDGSAQRVKDADLDRRAFLCLSDVAGEYVRKLRRGRYGASGDRGSALEE